MKTIDVNARLATMKATSQFGAQMGRRDIVEDDTAEVAIQRVVFQDGAYDLGGAYWGQSPGEHLYCAMDEAGQVCIFVRAPSEKAARETVLEDYPDLTVQWGVDLAEVTNAYLEALLFAERDSGNPDLEDDTSLQEMNFDISDFAPSAVVAAREDVQDFISAADNLGIDLTDFGSQEVGHCFYFDRNGHGCGFRDRNHPMSRRAADLARKWPSVHCWVSEPAEGQAYGQIFLE